MPITKPSRSYLLLFVSFCACSDKPKSPEVPMPLPADADGTPVRGFPGPEVVQLESVETIQGTLHVTVGNAVGDYALVCNLDVNGEAGVQSCLAPRPHRNYLLFRKNTKWLIKCTGTFQLRVHEGILSDLQQQEEYRAAASKKTQRRNTSDFSGYRLGRQNADLLNSRSIDRSRHS
jgi:hypothetical protein